MKPPFGENMSFLPEQKLRLVMVRQWDKNSWYEVCQGFRISKT